MANGLLEARLWEFIQSNPNSTMKEISQNFERHEAGPGIGLLKGLGVKIDGGKFACENPESVSKEIAERTEFIMSPTIDSPLLEHFKGRKNLIEIVESVTELGRLQKQGKI